MKSVWRNRGLWPILLLPLYLFGCGGEHQSSGPLVIETGEADTTHTDLSQSDDASTQDASKEDGSPQDTPNQDASTAQPLDASSITVPTPAGAKMIVLTEGARRFAVSGDSAWWTQPNGPKVMRVSLSSGKVSEIATEVGLNKTGDIAATDQAVFWTSLGPTLYFIRSLTTQSLTKTTVLSAKPQIAPQIIDRIAVDDTHVYFTTGSNPGPNYTGLLRRVKVGEGVVEDLQQWQKEPTDLALLDGQVYWTTRKGPAVQRIAQAGGAPETIVKQVTGALAVAVDDTFVYFCNAPGLSSDLVDGTVMRVARDGGTPETIADQQHNPIAIAVEPQWVWWINEGQQKTGFVDGALMRFARDGSHKAEAVYLNLARPVALHLHDGALFWLSAGSEHPDYKKAIPGALFRLTL